MENHDEFIKCVASGGEKKIMIAIDPLAPLSEYLKVIRGIRDDARKYNMNISMERSFSTEKKDFVYTPQTYSRNEVYDCINNQIREDKRDEAKARLSAMFPFDEWNNNMPRAGVRKVLCNEYLDSLL